MPKYSTDERPAPQLDDYYTNLHNYVQMVTGGYSNLLMLDAKGGLGKTHNVCKVLSEECENDQWFHQRGFTTPLELYKILWMARKSGSVLFLDDMSGITSNTKAIDMLKSATDTEGSENWVEYRTSRDIQNPEHEDDTLPNSFCFNGRIIMSFNNTPDNRHFDALKDRGTYYNLTFSYEERIGLIKEVAKLPTFSNLSIGEQTEVANWIETVTDPSFEVTIRSFEEICKMREFSHSEKGDDNTWRDMGFEVFGIDREKYRIIEMRKSGEMSVEEQCETWCQEFDYSESTYYDRLAEIKDER